MSFFGKLFGNKSPVPNSDEIRWQQVYDARATLYETHFGKLPDDILKLGDLFGVWPGGGLYVIPAPKLGNGMAVYASFGLSNPDMPTEFMALGVQNERDALQRNVETSMTLTRKENPRPKTDKPGYGYELIIVAQENAEWPLWILQWAVKAEIGKDADILGRVESYKGLTVERVQVGSNAFVNLLFTKAKGPLPASLLLPNGEADLIVATVITDDEMKWSIANGREALLGKLINANIGQMSYLGRESIIVHETPPAQLTPAGVQLTEQELRSIKSLETALAFADQGKLCKCLLFPSEFSGEDILMNQVYVPFSALETRTRVLAQIKQSVQQGEINKLEVRPEYKGDCFVPSKLLFLAAHSTTGKTLNLTVEIW